ncbi:MAG TPA: protein-disulfide reductase DsbD domain-containing protein, partial [Ferruginibacter sp.]|nr:protein-disulfide reductase DsbD domain-containing protein [Ferruginibacter sp.]
TSIHFSKNPLTVLDGKIKEVGAMKKKHEKVFNVDVHYYKDKVDFVQVVKLKTNAKTSVSGTVEFMVCDEEQCLPPEEVPFKIKLQ